MSLQELSGGLRAEDLMSSLRSAPSAPVQKSQDVVAGKLSAHMSRRTQLTWPNRHDCYDPRA